MWRAAVKSIGRTARNITVSDVAGAPGVAEHRKGTGVARRRITVISDGRLGVVEKDPSLKTRAGMIDAVEDQVDAGVGRGGCPRMVERRREKGGDHQLGPGLALTATWAA